MWNYISSYKVLFGHVNKIKDYWEIPSWKIREVHGFVLSMLEVLLQVVFYLDFLKQEYFPVLTKVLQPQRMVVPINLMKNVLTGHTL